MRANFNLQKSSRNGISDVYAENNPENLMIKVHEMQSIAFMLNWKFFSCYAKVMLNAWSTVSCLKLYWHNLSKLMVSSQVTDSLINSPTSTCRRIKSSRNVGELVFNPVQLIRS